MSSSTRRLSGGKSEGISRGSSTIAAAGGGTGSSGGTLAERKLSQQTIKVQSKPTRTFLEQKVSRAPEATYIPTPAPLPKPNKDLQTLADTYGDIEKGLRGATTAFLDREKLLNEEAKKEADQVAAKYAISGGSALEPLDKIRNEHELGSRNQDLSTEERAYHLKQYNTLRNIDPRVNDYLGDALQYQAGLKLVSGMYSWSQNLQTEDGQPLILNPHEQGADGQPNQLDQKINDYLGQITSSKALDRLSGQIANQRVAIYSYYSEKYAQQQDIKHGIAFQTDLTEGITNAGENRVDGINGDGSYLTQILTDHKQRGASLKSQEEIKKNLLESLLSEAIAASTLPDGTIDNAKLEMLTTLIEQELINARTGPQDQVETIFHSDGKVEVIDKRPFLHSETTHGTNLGNHFGVLMDQKLNTMDEAAISGAKRKATKAMFTELQQKEQEWNNPDIDPNTPGIQQRTINLDGRKIVVKYDLLTAYSWIAKKRDEIYNSGEDPYTVRAKLKVLSDFESSLMDRALAKETRFDIYGELEAGIISNEVLPVYQLARINKAERLGLIDRSQAADLRAIVRDKISISDQNINEVIRTQEKALWDRFSLLAQTGNLGTGTGFEADQAWSATELARYELLMRSTKQEVAKVLANKDLDENQKIQKVNELYSNLTTKLEAIKGNTATVLDAEAKREVPFEANKQPTPNKGREVNIEEGEPKTTVTPALSDNKEASSIITGENSRTTDTGAIEIKTASGEWIPKDQVFIEAALTTKENQTLETYKTNAVTLNRRIEILEKAPDYEGKEDDINKLKETLEIVNNHIIKTTNKLQEQGYVPLAQKETYQNGYNNPVIGTNGLPYKTDLLDVTNIEISGRDRYNIVLVSTGEFHERYAAHSGAEGMFKPRPVPYSYMLKRRKELAYQIATGGKFVWVKHKGKDRLIVVGGEDMRTVPTTSNVRSDHYNDNPNQVVKNMWKGRDLKKKDRMLASLNKEVLYETNIFQDQILAIINESAFVPYDNAVNEICEKLGITPFEYLSKQYEAHYGEPMPEDLQRKVIDGLNVKGHKFNKNPKLWREGLVYPEKKNENLKASLDNDPGVLFASSTGLGPGMIPGPPPRIDPSENKKLYPDGIETGNYILPVEVSNDKEFVAEVEKLSTELDIPVNYLWAVMGFETGGTYDPGQYNLGADGTKESGSGAVGLIQFTPATLKEWGVTTEQAAKMTRLEQMKLVRKHLKRYIKPGDDFRDVYMSILFPAALGKPNDFVLFGKGAMKGYTDTAYEQNKGLDKNGDGSVTKEEAASSIPQYLLAPPVPKKKESSTISGGSDYA